MKIAKGVGCLLVVVRTLVAGAQTVQPEVLYSFAGPDGLNPSGNLVEGTDGNFYGTTLGGGTMFGGYSGGSIGYGTVFKVAMDGTLTTLVSFAGTNGANPYAGLTLGNDGNFYGTTRFGGAFGGGYGIGTVFRTTTNGTLTTLVSFGQTNGASPYAGLTQGDDGDFYGTTFSGGRGNPPMGTVFRMTTNGVLTTLVSFNRDNGAMPSAGLVQAKDGNFYGTTTFGGSLVDGSIGRGTVFRVTTNGTFTTLVSLPGLQGFLIGVPQGGLALGNDGFLYVTTFARVLKVSTNGTWTELMWFNDRSHEIYPNGIQPYAGLTLGDDSLFYGTTSEGGTNGYGTVFRVSGGTNGTTLVTFNGANGANPYAGLTLGRDGNFYGTTSKGGSRGGGVIFRLGNPPTIMVQPATRASPPHLPVTFTISAVGGLPLAYQWFKNGVSLTDCRAISGSRTASLRLAKASAADAACYYAVITNNYGAVTSHVAGLTILSRGESVLTDLQMGVPDPLASTLTCQGMPDTTYIVQYSTNLVTGFWFDLSTNMPDRNGIWTVVDPAAAEAQKFYRVKHTRSHLISPRRLGERGRRSVDHRDKSPLSKR